MQNTDFKVGDHVIYKKYPESKEYWFATIMKPRHEQYILIRFDNECIPTKNTCKYPQQNEYMNICLPSSLYSINDVLFQQVLNHSN